MFCKKITIEDLYEIYLLCSTYEILAVKMCGGIFTGDYISRLEKVMELMKNLDSDYNTVLSYDHMFHKVIVEKSDSERLIKVWGSVN